MLKALLALAALTGAALLPFPQAHAAASIGIGQSFGLSPFWDWKTLETPNFRITFPAELEEVAQRASHYYEEAHAELSKELKWDGFSKAQVLVIDNDDAANGATTPVLRFGMVLNVTPPESWFSTAYYDDWLRLLVFHEYTHYLNIDTTSGLWTALRYVIGDVALPNSLWPSWMLEGLAVYDETRFTGAGRGRSTYYDMILRSAVESNVLDDPRFITLDKVNGPNPYYPYGESDYLFGFSLMNQIAHGQIQNGSDALGEMSLRSGARVPYLINGNLENITGKDFYAVWDDFVAGTRKHAQAQLAKIREKTVTPFTPVTRQNGNLLGSAVSPDGNWVAYTLLTSDLRQALYLQNLRTGEVKMAFDKEMGATLAFTPDSQALIYSSLRRNSEYYFMSDLGMYELHSGSHYWLTDRLRAKDPDLSLDGRRVVFTQTEYRRTSVAEAVLQPTSSGYRLEGIHKIFEANPYDRASTPKYSRDGGKVYFSLHVNGETGEKLMELNLKSGKARALVENGKMNRYPAISPSNEVYFVSDATGVDNLYRVHPDAGKVERVSNVTTGIAFPTFAKDGTLLADVFSYTGWGLAQTQLSDAVYPVSAAEVAAPSAPARKMDAPDSKEALMHPDYPVKSYSVFPSIWPREWAPLLLIAPGETYLGGEILGFDATDRHRYLITAAYDTLVKKPDLYALYSNRQLGVELDLSASNMTNSVTTQNNAVYSYSRRSLYTLSASYPFLWTYSSLTPAIAMSWDRTYYYSATATPPAPVAQYDQSQYVPQIDTTLSYQEKKASLLAIAPEEGRSTLLGARSYLGLGRAAEKLLLSDSEYFPLPGTHTVLIPSIKASYTTLNPRANGYLPADVLAQGKVNNLLTPIPGTSFDQLPVRGYPNQSFYARTAEVFAMDARFPLSYIYRGWGTNPVFLQNLYATVFGETTIFPQKDPGVFSLPSTGTGLRANTTVFLKVPLTLALDYQYGFRGDEGGRGQVIFSMGLAGMPL